MAKKKTAAKSAGTKTAKRKTTKKAVKKAKKKAPGKHKARKRETINTGRDTRYVRRNEQGEFKDVVEKGRSLAQDRRKKAKKTVKSGQGDKGDQARRK